MAHASISWCPSASPRPMRSRRGPGWATVAALGALVAFTFLGGRGLWEPDEGRYVEVAREMVVSGDYLTPTVNDVPHFTKPPLTYWMVAAGLRVVGMNEWGARLGHGVAFALTVLLVAALGDRMWGPGGRWAGPVYATMLLVFAAGSVVTPDTLLTLWVTAALLAFWRARTAGTIRASRGWAMAFWLALGLAFLTKGPPALLALAVVVTFTWLAPASTGPDPRTTWLWPPGWLAGLALAAPWFLLVAHQHPGLVEYLLGTEVVGRVTSSVHHRNSRWYLGPPLYLAVIVLGALPWSLTWVLAARGRRLGAGWAAIRGAVWSGARPPVHAAFLACWIVVPLLVLSLARSRLPLYALPVFPALALATTAGLLGRGGWTAAWPRLRSVALVAMAAWIAVLLALRLGAAWWPGVPDARAMSRWLTPHLLPGRTEVVVVEGRIHALPFYLGVPVELVARRPQRAAGYRALAEPWEEEIGELTAVSYRHVFVMRRSDRAEFTRLAAARQASCRPAAGPPGYSLLVCDPDPPLP